MGTGLQVRAAEQRLGRPRAGRDDIGVPGRVVEIAGHFGCDAVGGQPGGQAAEESLGARGRPVPDRDPL